MTTLAHISDLHVGSADFQEELLLKVIRELNEIKPAAVIITGDITNQGYYREYIKAKEYIDMIDSPTVVIPGNHDARNIGDETFEEVIGRRYSNVILEDEKINIIALDSSEPDLDYGKIGRLQRKFMEKVIDKGNEGNYFNIIALHHHIISVPNTGRERNVLSDAGDILETLLEKKVPLVLSGHKHVPHVWQMNGTIFLTASTASSLKLRGNTHPSYNLIHVEDNEVKITLHNYDGTIKELKA